MNREKDIFDRIAELKCFSFFLPFFEKHREAILYVFFGGLTTLVSIVTFWIFISLGMNELAANAVSWILAVLFAFLTNRKWVFTEKKERGLVYELVSFYGGRLLTLGMEELILLVFVTLMKLPAMPVKMIAQVAVIVMNYVISKLVVFK